MIAAGPPINWSKTKTANDAMPYLDRSYYAYKIIESEVLKKNRTALIIFGGAHFYRSTEYATYPARLRTMLEKNMNGKKVDSVLILDKYGSASLC